MIRKTFVLSIMTSALAFIASICAFAQNDVYNYTMVEEKPTFNGQNITQVPRWLYENAKFPENMDLEQLKGKAAIISITIGTEGKLTDAKVMKSISEEIDEIIINTLLDSEGWTPGKQRGTPVKVNAMIKIAF